MATESEDAGRITIIAAAEETEGMRSVSGVLTKQLEIGVDELALNINLFLNQMEEVVAKTPDTVGKLQLAGIEVSTEITGKGQVVLWGIGGEVGGGGGIKFVFKKPGF